VDPELRKSVTGPPLAEVLNDATAGVWMIGSEAATQKADGKRAQAVSALDNCNAANAAIARALTAKH
jgi:hypothetical protein